MGNSAKRLSKSVLNCFTRDKQKKYRQRLPDNNLIRLVYGICQGVTPLRILDDWFLDHPMHRHDLCLILWLARIEYDERDNPRSIYRHTIKEIRRNRREAYHDLWDSFMRGQRQGLANSCILSTCQRLLNIDHLGRSLDVHGRPYLAASDPEGEYYCNRDKQLEERS